MTDLIRRATPVALLVLTAFAAAAPAASAAPVSLNVRIEGASKTYYEGPVTTDGHNLTTASAGTRKCDGTNNGAYPTPGPTPFAALDDAARLGRFTWDADWFDSFQDFLLTRIAGEPTSATTYWALYVNYAGATVGGCQIRSKAGDEVLLAQAPFSTPLGPPAPGADARSPPARPRTCG